jgi:hypothetical protein
MKEFYRTIVVPMANKCANWQLYGHSFGGEKKNLCARVKKVVGLFIGLNGGRQHKIKHKNGQPMSMIGAFMLGIRTLTYHDLFKLQADQVLALDEKIEIQDEASKIASPIVEVNLPTFNLTPFYQSIRVNWTKTFVETFGQIIEELKGVKSVGEDGIIGSQKVTYKLLCIGDDMRMKYRNGDEELAWAFQQFAANLAIYALRLDKPSQQKIQQIVASWPLGMFAEGEPSQEHRIV